MCTQLTYEGLIDEVYGIKSSKLSIFFSIYIYILLLVVLLYFII